MKNTLNDENRLLDGGYAEEVFDDMLYREYSKMAGQQSLLSELNRALLEQLQSK
nr:rod-binding protein [Halanaerobium polyolivorans]